ncbi:hypothetical protein VOLCADRAFT_105600 [Volvox carteri f. nagariensis]|uniref:Uncharacterized protein n=1 Tax=Volvox carteri f. nagariensis TaxID=3068 RepID=D8U1T9_VOLCA|nr:uncharacterized protein VOLCADRAFT_105600 [Volvox carteri f. nagariensis]EFJ46171.1 hypothetical protein VOLCADRAFT_105600 [Volvox carteri f. nagariensis]|eukprot:XP_002952618.1 hypothetical protein VOLCADRAFT_105600 [Volvox carteri f. nagariensis]
MTGGHFSAIRKRPGKGRLHQIPRGGGQIAFTIINGSSICKRRSGTLLSAVGFDSDEDNEDTCLPQIPPCHAGPDATAQPPQEQQEAFRCDIPTAAHNRSRDGGSPSPPSSTPATAFGSLGACPQSFRGEPRGFDELGERKVAPDGTPTDAIAWTAPLAAFSLAPPPPSATAAVAAVAAASPRPRALFGPARDVSTGCATPLRDEGEMEWGSGTPSTGSTPHSPGKDGTAAAAAVVVAEDGWSFDTPPRRAGNDGGGGGGVAMQRIPARSPLGVPAWLHGGRSGAGAVSGVEGEVTLGTPCRKARSPATPSAAAAAVTPPPPGSALPLGSAVGCYPLAPSPDFSPTLPLPSTALFTRDTPGGSGGSDSNRNALQPPPQRALLQAALMMSAAAVGEEEQAQMGDGTGSTPSPSVVAAPHRRRPLLKTPQIGEPQTPQTSFRNPAKGVPLSALPSGPVSIASCSSVPVTRPGSASRRSGAGAVTAAVEATIVTPGSVPGSTAARGVRPTPSPVPGSARSSVGSGSDGTATCSGKKPRYLKTTVSWNLKHG